MSTWWRRITFWCVFLKWNRCNKITHTVYIESGTITSPDPKRCKHHVDGRSAKRLRSCGHFYISKMAVSRHLGFYRTANSTIRSTDHENPSPESNMEWMGCTVCELFAFKVYRDLETGVRGHSRSSKVILFDRAHTTLYSSSIVTMPLSITVSEI